MAYAGKIASQSTAGSNGNTAVKILKTVYESGIQEALPLEFNYYKFAKANADDIRFKGDHWEFDVHFARNDRAQAFLPSETLPNSGAAVFDIASLGIARVAAPLAIDHELVMLAKDDESAFSTRAEALYQDTKDALMRNLNRMAVGDGTGVMGTIATSGVGVVSGSGAASREILTLADTKFFEEGQAVEVWNAARTTQRGATAGYVVSAVSSTTITLKPADGSTTTIDVTGWIATDVVVRKGSQNGDGTSKEMSGLQAIVGANAPTTYQGLSGSTYRRWNGYRHNASSAAASPLLIAQAQIAHRRAASSGAKWDFAFTAPEQAAKLLYGTGAAYGAGYARYSPGEISKLGTSETPTVAIPGMGEVAVQADIDLPTTSMFLGRKQDLLFIELHPVKLEEFGGVSALPATDGAGGVLAADQMWFVTRANFGARKRNEFCEIYGLA